ncbi:MAG: DUF1592 domain-containing protein [Bryobacteraceae bacterium]
MANPELATLDTSSAVWPKVLDKLATGRMPPAGSPRPAPAEIAAVTGWIERTLGVRSAAASAKPPHMTARRLNRAEYNNTIRDLFGVSLRPADEFPLDDAGYGFDNIGDVLSVSPLLMEKYMTAARAVSRAAVYGPAAPAKPGKLVRFMTKKSQDDPTPLALPFSNRGALYGRFDFPVTGYYELRMRVANYRPRTTGTPRQRELSRKRNLTAAEKAELSEANRLSYPPVKMVLTLDGAPVLSEVVEGNIDYQYAHGESVARVRITAGEHSFRASYPEFASMEDPLDNVNLDGRRKLFIDYLDIVGPFEAEPPKPAIAPCADAACADRVIAQYARRAYRRPVTQEDLDPLLRLAAMVRDSGDSVAESIRVALQAMLVSPHFLFQFAGSEYHLASRLSYFLWSSMPDEALVRDAGRLQDPAVMEAHARRMLADGKSDALIDNFVGQWLGLRTLDKRKPDPRAFPLADDEVLEAMRRETLLFARAILRENRSVLEFLDGRYTYVNGPLARYYGIGGVDGEEFQRVELDGEQRGGLVTQGSVLTLSSYATRTSPVLRGRWVLESLLGEAPPPPPPNIPALEEGKLGEAASLRQRLEQHRANPSCAVCHDQMDAIGFSLENYDAAGAWRERDGRFAIDNGGKMPGGETFHGPQGLKGLLQARRDAFLRNLTEKMLTYALGRGVEPTDRETVEGIAARTAADGYRFSTLVMEIVKSSAFRAEGKAQGGENVR